MWNPLFSPSQYLSSCPSEVPPSFPWKLLLTCFQSQQFQGLYVPLTWKMGVWSLSSQSQLQSSACCNWCKDENVTQATSKAFKVMRFHGVLEKEKLFPVEWMVCKYADHVYLYSFQTMTKGSTSYFLIWSLIYWYIQLTVSIYSIRFSKTYVPMKSLPVYLQGISVLQNLLMTLCSQFLPLPLAPDNHWSAF